MQLLVQKCLDPCCATEIFSVPKRRIFALPKIVRYRNKSGLQSCMYRHWWTMQEASHWPKRSFTTKTRDNRPFLQNLSCGTVKQTLASFFFCFDVLKGITPKRKNYRPISSQPFSAGCHGNQNWWPIWKVAWWARVSCRRSRMYGIQCKLVQFCPVIPHL